MATILKDKYEINKPSYLTQIVYYDNATKTLVPVDSTHLDLVNSMYYLINKEMRSSTIDKDLKNRIINSEKDDIGSEVFEIKMKDVSTMIGKYSYSQYEKVIKKINELRHIDVVINALNKDKEMTRTTASVIGNINEVVGKNTSIKAQFPRVLVKSYFNTQKYFKKHYLTIQFSLKSKYSKLLYEIAKDYEGLENGKTIELTELIELLNVTTDSMKAPSRFKAHILKKSVEEINRVTDIEIKWTMNKKHKQYFVNIKSKNQSDDRLRELGLIEEPITSNKFYIKSKNKLDDKIKKGYNQPHDEEGWIKTDINRYKDIYESEIRVDTWSKETDIETKNYIFENIAATINVCDDPTVCIEDYKLRGVFSSNDLTSNAKDTLHLINKVTEELNDE